jgi:predicted RNA-binding Zn-ribbon protein involved in translation (DUF1610 family)
MTSTINNNGEDKTLQQKLIEQSKQLCPKCGSLIGIVKGSRDAVCQNCGYKDPCCE